ncbi:MAG: hypothetical protein AAF363_12630 [Bacteroidota bacterium]
MVKQIIYLLIFFAGFMVSCVNSDEGPVLLRETQLTRLITGDSSKVWQLMSRSLDGIPEGLDDCELDDVIVVGASADSILIVFLQGAVACPEVVEDFIVSTEIEDLMPVDTTIFTQGDSVVIVSYDSTVIDLDSMITRVFQIIDTLEVPIIDSVLVDSIIVSQPITTIDRDTAVFVQFGSLNPSSSNQIFQDTLNFRRFKQEGLTDSTEIVIELLTSEMLNWAIQSDSGVLREEYQFIEGL